MRKLLKKIPNKLKNAFFAILVQIHTRSNGAKSVNLVL